MAGSQNSNFPALWPIAPYNRLSLGGYMSGLRRSAPRALALLVVLALAEIPASADTVGSIFLTGHDPDFHALEGGNTVGAADITKTAISFVTDKAFNPFAAGGIDKFLYVTSDIAPPGGHVDGTNGIIASGYTLGTNFDRVDASGLVAGLRQLGTKYDALVIASDFGGILTQTELDILDAHSTEIINFLNHGGGLYAMAESDGGAGLTPDGGRFGFLPFIVTSTQFNEFEAGNTLTAFGSSVGLTSSDINGNFSHNIFTSTGGLNIVDQDASGDILSLAGRGKVTGGGVSSVPEPSSLFATALLVAGMVVGRRRMSRR
jgi:hypothetical protein